MVDAIIHRKPVALKAIYYLIEKRLKQGLSFPDPDYNSLLHGSSDGVVRSKHDGEHHATFKTTFKSSNQSLDSAGVNAQNNAHVRLSGNGSATPNPSATGGGNLTKQNSQLLPKRHTGIQLAQRSSSQKNVDFKTMFNGLILNSTNTNNNNTTTMRNSGSVLNNYKDSNDGVLNNVNNSHSPSPDFIAAAMSPIKTLAHANAANSVSHNNVHSASSARGGGASRLGLSSATSNHTQLNNEATAQHVVSRKMSQTSSSSNPINQNRVSYPAASTTTMNAAQNGDYRVDHRYYAPSSASSHAAANHRLSQQKQPTAEEAYETARNSANNNGLKVSHSVAGSIRSLPSSVYRGSPERAMQKSPDRHHHHYQERPASRVSSSSRTGHHHYQPHHYMPEGSVASSTATDKSNGYDLPSSNQKLRMTNYLATKRSMTLCDEPNYSKNAIGLSTSQSVKNRQLHMGKAKIDLETQTSKFTNKIGKFCVDYKVLKI